MKIHLPLLSALLLATAAHRSHARTVEYDLHIAETIVSPAGKPLTGLTLNGSIPGPTLRFMEGDWARIRVHNDLPHHSTSTHWHGLLVPNAQDGVPEVTTPSILPGTTHTFEFPIIQSGTYWYHSHTHFQEQQGIYGAIVIQPKSAPASPRAGREQVLLMSDWTNEDPHEVYRSLARGTEWYSLKKGTTQSLYGAWKAGALPDFFARERTRMKPMDLSDIAYDAFLINGQPNTTLSGNPGETIRLRLINGSSATYFYLTSSTGPLTLVAADGKPVKPVKVGRLLMAIGETYDALITLPATGTYQVRATAQDGSGHATATFGSGPLHPATDPPLPELYRMDHMLEAALDEGPGVRLPRPTAPYPILESPTPTAFPKNRPIRDIALHLTGDMERYLWSFNGKTMTEESVVPIRKGEILRIELINDTMMHHPIHLHGFFFRLVNQHGTRSPLKHTVDLPPMGGHTIEFEANTAGDWMFHCHLLYHMMAGMGRVFSVKDDQAIPASTMPDMAMDMPDMKDMPAMHHHSGISLGPKKAGVKQAEALGVNLGEHAHDMPALWANVSLQSHLSEGLINYRQLRDDYQIMWEAGWQNTDTTEYETDATWERWLGPDFRAFVGARFTNIEDANHRAIAGLRYRLPGMFWSTALIDSEGDARLSLTKTLQLTSRLAAFGKVDYDTGSQWEWSAGAEYVLTKSLSLVGQYSSDYGLGGGVNLRF
jgi:FtsP/CotA-like multicopper oxidase with cupredoxin domain